MAPAQLYSTESGRLFHAGRIVICTVGLPARGKTHISVSLTRYLRWLGVKCRAFHLGDYRRATLGPGNEVPDDYFHVNGKSHVSKLLNISLQSNLLTFPASPESVQLRENIVGKCREDIIKFLDEERGQVAIYDAVNPTKATRAALDEVFAKQGIQTLFFESVCTDESIIRENVRSVKISSPDYFGWDPDKAVKDYLDRINAKIPHFETIEDSEKLNYIQMINAGEQYLTKNISFGYLHNRILFYLMNLHIKRRQTYFARAAKSQANESFKADAEISEDGKIYAEKLAETIIRHREEEHKAIIASGRAAPPVRPLIVWTSTRQRTYATADPMLRRGYKVFQKTELVQLNPGVIGTMTPDEIAEQYPEEIIKHNTDPYHHRFPRAEVCFAIMKVS
jgi:6-phosphofructo-2-kinase/fructose-2,6-biphosphatase 4